MPPLSLKVRIVERGIVKTLQFEPPTLVYDACKAIRDKLPEANNLGNGTVLLIVKYMKNLLIS